MPLHQSVDAVRPFSAEPDPERHPLHAKQIERAWGDWYCVCSCGWLSLPLINAHRAAQAECPREQADAEVYRNRLRFYARAAANL